MTAFTGGAMDFPHIDNALAVCRRHLSELDDALPDRVEIERLLVASMVLLVVSHYENHIADQFVERAAHSGDRHVENFVKKQLSRRFWSPDIGKINDTLKEFGAEYRERFASRVENTKAHASWDNIMRARHTIVHTRSPTNMTLRELEAAYRESHKVLAALRAGLGLIHDAAA